MKFVLNFIFYGILFFLIWRYFPDGFNTLVSWVTSVWDIIVDVAVSVVDKIKASTGSGSSQSAIFLPIAFMTQLFKR